MNYILETGKISAVVIEDAGESACYHDGVVCLVEDREGCGLEWCVGEQTPPVWRGGSRDRSVRFCLRVKSSYSKAIEWMDLQSPFWVDVTFSILVGEECNGIRNICSSYW